MGLLYFIMIPTCFMAKTLQRNIFYLVLETSGLVTPSVIYLVDPVVVVSQMYTLLMNTFKVN